MAGALSLVCISTTILTAVLTDILIRWQAWVSIFDIPNARSSHNTPKPRTGGIAIFLSLSCGYLLWRALQGPRIHPIQNEPLVIAGAVAFFSLGLLEDIFHLPEWLRLVVQAGFALVIALWGPRLRIISLPGGSWILPKVASVGLTTFWCTGFINLFNFMDGIDGIAAGEALVVGLFMALASRMSLILLIPAATLGFGIFNQEPSKIFMGDSGSYLLGYLLAIFSVLGTGTVPFVVYVMFLGTFIIDPTVTLARRILQRETWLKAHRSHYYQRATNLVFSHARVCWMNLGLTTLLGLSGLLYSFIGVALQLVLLIFWIIIFCGLVIAIHHWESARTESHLGTPLHPKHDESAKT